jgi:hypothetical protein
MGANASQEPRTAKAAVRATCSYTPPNTGAWETTNALVQYQNANCINCITFEGSLFGHDYDQTFASFAAYADWRTDLAVLPGNRIYTVFAAMCQNQGCDANEAYQLSYVFQALVYNLTWEGRTVDRANLDGYWKDPATVFHDESWYSGFFLETPHLIQNVGEPFSAHVDPFGPFNPLHYVIQIPSMLFPPGQSGTATCSLNGGCTLSH